MAAAVLEGEAPEFIECGYCYQREEEVQDPRVLPCSHVYCKVCLDGQAEKHRVINCPACRKTFDVVVDNLPTYKPGGLKHRCDACITKGKDNQGAVMYCKTCNRKCCEKHQESHDDLLTDHTTMPIAEYEIQASSLETRNCTKHKEQAYSLGCGVCLAIFCNSCISPSNICTDGKPHELHNLGHLAKTLAEKMEQSRAIMRTKEEQLSAVFKTSSKMVSDFQNETKNMTQVLRQTRDQQIEVLQTKYIELEDELLETRNATEEKMKTFMEEQVGADLSNLNNKRLVYETRLGQRHQVDIVNTYRDTHSEIAKLQAKELPVLAVDEVKALGVRGEKREIEGEIVSEDNIYIGCEPGLVIKRSPKSLSFLISVETGSFCHSVCHYKGRTFVGTDRQTINVVGNDSKLKKFVGQSGQQWSYGLAVHENKIYSLSSGTNGPGTVNVYDLWGKPLDRWNRLDNCQHTRPAIISNQLIVPDHKGHQLTVYTLSGEPVTHIPCDFLGSSSVVELLYKSSTAVCRINQSSVIVTSYSNSVVARVDVTAKKVVWTSNAIPYPQAAAMHGLFLVCIASEKKISFLNVNTGNVAAETVAPNVSREVQLLRQGHYIDIDINDGTLIVSTHYGLLYYKLDK